MDLPFQTFRAPITIVRLVAHHPQSGTQLSRPFLARKASVVVFTEPFLNGLRPDGL